MTPRPQLVADGLTATSAVSASWAWLSHANEILTFIATIVAIVSGCLAIRYHWRKTRELDEPRQ